MKLSFGLLIALVATTCVNGQGCAPADFLFVLDSSGSVGDDFRLQRQFIEDFVSQLIITPNRHRVALIEYSGTQQNLEIAFGDYDNNDDLQATIRRLQHYAGTTKIGLALRAAEIVLGQRRSGYKTVVIALTDGLTQDDLKGPADVLRNLPGVEVYAVGVASPLYKQQLYDIAGSEDRTFFTSNPQELLNALRDYTSCAGEPRPAPRPKPEAPKPAPPVYTGEQVHPRAILTGGRLEAYTPQFIEEVAKYKPRPEVPRRGVAPVAPVPGRRVDPGAPTPFRPRPPPTGRQGCVMDVLFVVDASGSVTGAFRNELALANRIVDRLIVGESNARVGLIVFSDPHTSFLAIPFDEYHTKQSLQRRISDIEHVGGTTSAHDALRLAASTLSRGEGVRSHARQVVIMLTDGLFEQSPKSAASAVQQNADEVYAVSTGEYANPLYLIDIAGEGRSFKRDTLSEFEQAMDQLFAQCR